MHRARDNTQWAGAGETAVTGEPAPRALVDSFGRPHRSLRVSVTDRCNLRCRYCMPPEGMPWIPTDGVLGDDEIVGLVTLLAQMGIRDVRITGGEPLIRPGLPRLIERIHGISGIQEISMTTNGVLLAAAIDDLVAAGLDRVNVSVDSLDPERFARMTRRNDLERVLEGLAACERHPGLRPIKVNAVALRGVSEDDVLPLAELARRRGYVVRFIEAMPLDATREWTIQSVLSGEDLRRMIGARWPLEAQPRERPSAPATAWRFADGRGTLQFVSSVTEPFCARCDRLRLTADGRLRTCLFATEETDLLGALRAGLHEPALRDLITTAVLGKPRGHAIGNDGWSYEGRPMSRIGG